MKKILFVIILFFVFTPKVFSADLSFVNPSEAFTGKTFSLSVMLDTKGEVVNSADVSFSFDADKVSFEGYESVGSVLKLWIIPPQAKGNTIHFSGLIPGGAEGTYDPNFANLQKLPLVKLLFKAKAGGVNNFTFIKTEVLKHDGLGTSLPVSFLNGSINLKQDGTKEENTNTEKIDNTPPEEFEIYFSEASVESNTPNLLVFSAVDKDTGILKYQIRRANVWQDTLSPAPVYKGIFDQRIVVRAIDYAGNVREADIVIEGIASNFYISMFFLILILGFVSYKLLKYKHGKKP